MRLMLFERSLSFAVCKLLTQNTSSYAIAVSISSSSSRDCSPSRLNLPSMARETSSFLPGADSSIASSPHSEGRTRARAGVASRRLSLWGSMRIRSYHRPVVHPCIGGLCASRRNAVPAQSGDRRITNGSQRRNHGSPRTHSAAWYLTRYACPFLEDTIHLPRATLWTSGG